MDPPTARHCAFPNCGRAFDDQFTGHQKCHKHADCVSETPTGVIQYRAASCSVCLACLATKDPLSYVFTPTAVTFGRRLREWIRAVAKNGRSSRTSTEPWSVITDKSERDFILGFFRKIKPLRYLCDSSLPRMSLSCSPSTSTVTVPSRAQFFSFDLSSSRVQGEERGEAHPISPSGDDVQGGWDPDLVPYGSSSEEELEEEMDQSVEEDVYERRFSGIEKRFQDLQEMLATSLRPPCQTEKPHLRTSAALLQSGVRSISPQPGPSGCSLATTTSSDEEDELQPWRPIAPGMRVLDRHTLVIDGLAYGRDQVEIDPSFSPPMYRFIFGTNDENIVVRPTKNPEVVMHPKEAFAGFGNLVVNLKNHIVCQTKETFSPGNKCFVTETQGLTFWDTFSRHVEKLGREFVSTGRWKFEEASIPFLVVPSESEALAGWPEGFMEFLRAKRFLPSCAQEQLLIPGLPKLSGEGFQKEIKYRMIFLSTMSTFLGLETLGAASETSNWQRALVSLAKSSIFTLNHTLQNFVEARLALRKEALKGCDLSSPHAIALLRSSFFSINLFGKQEVDAAIAESRRLNVTMADILKLRKTSVKRKASTDRRANPKKNRITPPHAPSPPQHNRGGNNTGRSFRGGRGRGFSRGRGSGSGQSQTHPKSGSSKKSI